MKNVLCAAALLLLLAVPLAVSAAPSNWMNERNGNLLISDLSIPGTHDSGARFEPFPGTAKCQNWTIDQQLNAGVRFLDIRCRHINDAFAIHHGSVYQNMNFDDVLNMVSTFLSNNPTECVVMSVKEEYNASNDTRTFAQTFDSYVAKNPGLWSLGSTIPTLGQVRGKIVLLRRFGGTSEGIDATNWADNATFFNGSNLRVQDNYNVSSNNTKWNQIVSLFNETATGNAWNGVQYINFTSGVQSIIGIPNITNVSNDINSRLYNYLIANPFTAPGRKYGIVAMDFADTDRCNALTNSVVFYQDVNYGGAMSSPLAKGSYTLAQLQAAGVPNDWASSCKIPAGWKVTIYQDDNFTGTSWDLYPDANLGQAYFTGYAGLNDAMTSVVIQ